MRLQSVITPVVTIAVLGGLAFAGYKTQDRWVPHVFPSKPAGKSGDSHGAGGEKADEHAGHSHEHKDQVKLSPQARSNLGLDKDGAVDVLIPEEYWRKVLIPGVVVDRPGVSDRGVTSRVAGIVTDIKARPGDTVKAGEPLFTIQLASEFIQSGQTDLAKTSKDLEAAKIKRDQTKMLVEKGSRPGIDLVEEENNVRRLTTLVNGYRRQLLTFGLTPDQVERAENGAAITEVAVNAPVRVALRPSDAPKGSEEKGPADLLYEVQELRVNIGDQVQAGQTLCLLANHQQLFVEGRAFKSEAKALAVAAEQGVPIQAEFADESPGDWPPQAPLTIRHLSNQVDPATRTFAFYLALENRAEKFTRHGKTHYVWRFRPGQRVRLKVPVERLGDEATGFQVYVLPAGAVVREGPEAFVFVQNGDLFVRKTVRVLYEDRVEAVVANDGA
ncbi:MAG: efflux RND transporter periplasmic adaptor subunit, partial [Gemmataceae bacterium]|nr:efflux RND transporter periplasmic adaptor subunit [Gemmataceae bacterium]